MWRLDLQLHRAPGVTERRLDQAAARVAVPLLLLLDVVDGCADEILFGSQSRAYIHRCGGVERRSERVVGVGLDGPRGTDVALRVGGRLLAGDEVSRGAVLACEIQE